ncbi:MAG: hypothetical protein ACLSDO_04775, partial [Anaerotruncus colihominis]
MHRGIHPSKAGKLFVPAGILGSVSFGSRAGAACPGAGERGDLQQLEPGGEMAQGQNGTLIDQLHA